MPNIDIRDFTTVSSVDGSDHVVLSLFGGAAGKMTVALFKAAVTRGIEPSIGEKGQWLIGEVDTGIMAEGKTPELRKGVTAIEYKYTTEEDSAWRPLISISELRLRYEDLTEEQRAAFKLKYEDLSEEDIAELQRPATEMIDKLEKTDAAVTQAEDARKEAESARRLQETSRMEAESSRVSAEDARVLAEQERADMAEGFKDSEAVRMSNEQRREASESERAEAELQRAEGFAAMKEDYEEIKSGLVTENRIVVLSESDYEDAVDAGTIDSTKLYFAFEEE